MSIFASISTGFLPINSLLSGRWLSVTCAALMFLACIVPWMMTPGAGTTLSVYDLGEWASLHPAVRAESPTLLTGFLIRMSISVAALAIATTDLSAAFRLIVVCLTAFALLPPFEFLADSGNANYRQLLLAAVITLSAGVATVYASRWRVVSAILMFTVGLVATGASTVGTLRMVELLRGFSLPVEMAGGLVLYAVGVLGLLVSAALRFLIKRKQG